MKTTLTILFATIFFVDSFAQNTTEEEYNWMSKGYKVMVSSGLDMKKGYFFDDNQEYSQGKYTYEFTYKFLRRDKDKSLAGVVIIAKSSTSGNTYYYGLPIGQWITEGGENGISAEFYEQSTYMSNFLTAIGDLDSSMTRAFFGTLWNLFGKNSMMYLPKTATPTKK